MRAMKASPPPPGEGCIARCPGKSVEAVTPLRRAQSSVSSRETNESASSAVPPTYVAQSMRAGAQEALPARSTGSGGRAWNVIAAASHVRAPLEPAELIVVPGDEGVDAAGQDAVAWTPADRKVGRIGPTRHQMRHDAWRGRVLL